VPTPARGLFAIPSGASQTTSASAARRHPNHLRAGLEVGGFGLEGSAGGSIITTSSFAPQQQRKGVKGE
jgi:hypothetical protein